LRARGLFLPGQALQPHGKLFLKTVAWDSYSNIRKLSEGLRKVRGGWERYRRGESEPAGAR